MVNAWWAAMVGIAAVASATCAGTASAACPAGMRGGQGNLARLTEATAGMVEALNGTLDHPTGPLGETKRRATEVSEAAEGGLSVAREYVVNALADGCMTKDDAVAALRSIADVERARGRLEGRVGAASPRP